MTIKSLVELRGDKFIVLLFCEFGQCFLVVVFTVCVEEEKGEDCSHPALKIRKVGKKEGQCEQVNSE